MAAKPAGSSGYNQFEYTPPEGYERAEVVSARFDTTDIYNTNGLQLSFVSVTATQAYINFYAPKATIGGDIEGNIVLFFKKINLR